MRNADGGLKQHPFFERLSQQVALTPADLRDIDKIIDGDLLIRRRHDLVVDGLEYRKLCFVKNGYALRYKLLRNGKRQIVNVILPGDVIGVPNSFFERSVYSVSAITDLTVNVCALDAYVQLCYRRPAFALALCWMAVEQSTNHAERVIDLGRRTPIERLAHFLLELHERLRIVGLTQDETFTLPFSQEILADVLGLSVPHLNRMMQQLRTEKLIADKERLVTFPDIQALRALAHYQPHKLAVIPNAELAKSV
ncbi:MAG TPA: Crp/Fnr family transcriptional regulator [Pseudolabrys sp.]|nr:Crp/Fnr family transcriptional regulator [Pseudolabrys sp.]